MTDKEIKEMGELTNEYSLTSKYVDHLRDITVLKATMRKLKQEYLRVKYLYDTEDNTALREHIEDSIWQYKPMSDTKLRTFTTRKLMGMEVLLASEKEQLQTLQNEYAIVPVNPEDLYNV